jgi:LPS O-antigen subunit length determinant protein (WzzB/FepE family)
MKERCMNSYELNILSDRLNPRTDFEIDPVFKRYCEDMCEILSRFKDDIDDIIKIVKFQSIDVSQDNQEEFIYQTTIKRLLQEQLKHKKLCLQLRYDSQIRKLEEVKLKVVS